MARVTGVRFDRHNQPIRLEDTSAPSSAWLCVLWDSGGSSRRLGKTLEERLALVQKMEAAEPCGVANDFDSRLTVVTGL